MYGWCKTNASVCQEQLFSSGFTTPNSIVYYDDALPISWTNCCKAQYSAEILGKLLSNKENTNIFRKLALLVHHELHYSYVFMSSFKICNMESKIW